jgi:hypothetical protein
VNAGDILCQAADKVVGDRNTSHGPMERTFQMTADIWSAYLGITVTPLDVANMNIHQKQARAKCGTYNPDDFEDMAGYAACGGQIAGNEK